MCKMEMSVEARMARAAELLTELGCSCVIVGPDGGVTTGHRRGVRDMYEWLTGCPEVLCGAVVADKVVGKGAAALMVVGGVAGLYARVISRPALELLRGVEGMRVRYDVVTEGVINHAGTGPCPVERMCRDIATAGECVGPIGEFLASLDGGR